MTREVYPPLNKQNFLIIHKIYQLQKKYVIWIMASYITKLKDNQVNYIIKNIENFYCKIVYINQESNIRFFDFCH